MTVGQRIVDRALEHEGEKYFFGADVPIYDPAWKGPWDCAEFVTWNIYQETGAIYGCVDNEAPIADLDAYSGAFKRDILDGTLIKVSVEKALTIPGAILWKKGHVALSRGDGTTIEAKSTADGVGSWPAEGRFSLAGVIPEDV